MSLTLRLITLFIIFCFVFSSCSTPSSQQSETSDASLDDSEMSAVISTSPSLECEDMGQEYIDSFVFLGESTTTHLKSRGVLSGGTKTAQVWSTKSGTLMLSRDTAECRIVYPETGEELDLFEAMHRKKPKYMLLTFGLNGATGIIARGEEYFASCYEKLVDTLLYASPETVIILQSCFPIASNMDMSNYSVDAKTLNGYIDLINTWARSFAEAHSLGYLNSSEVLKGADGFLLSEYQVGDGYHLTKSAYIKILKYIRTHSYLVKEA